MSRFVLVHGAFYGAWAWEPLKEELGAGGHSVDTLDLPSFGEDQTPASEVTFATAVKAVTDLLRTGEPAILVGHSMGGMIVTQAAHDAPTKVKRLVYCAAFLPEDGESLQNIGDWPEGATDQVHANMAIEPPVATLDQELTRTIFFGECDEATATWASSQTSPTPLMLMTTPIAVGDFVTETTPAYVYCAKDNALPPPLQRRMLERRGVTDVLELDSDHSPMLSHTSELAAFLGALETDS